MLALGVDTSNYATSLAVVDTARKEVVCAQKRFLPVKEGERGLRQNDAVFQHTVALPVLLREAQAICDIGTIEAVGVSERPRPQEGSYMPCFLPGVAFAEAFAATKGLPLVKTSHQQGHLAAALLGAKNEALCDHDILFFHASGGTTELLLTHGMEVKKTLGGSRDLYAGQAVDRLGVQLGFPFPAGEYVSEIAETCQEEVTPTVSVQGMDCHLSGLQNQCEWLLAEGKTPAYVAKYCLVAIARTTKGMLAAAWEQCPGLRVLCAGGVMASSVIRKELDDGTMITFAPPVYSADNAMGTALIAGLAARGG